MKNVKISLQKVIAILKRDYNEYRNGLTYLNTNYNSVIVKTGAKILRDQNQYWLCGYHYAGEDVDYYFQKRR